MIKVANANCLAGMACPSCKNDGPFKIAATALFTIHDDGTGAFGDVEYDDGSYCACPQCDFDGIVWDFKKGDRTMTRTFTTADADRLLGFADRYLEDWAEDAIQAGERDEVYEERNAEWQAIRPLLVAAPDMHEALVCPSLEKAHDQLSEMLEDPDAGNDAIRDAALAMCDALHAFWRQRDAALATAKGSEPAATPTCDERAQWAENAVIAYAQAKEGREYDPLEEMASDLFADLCHLFVREGVSPERMMERARLHYEEECSEEGIIL